MISIKSLQIIGILVNLYLGMVCKKTIALTGTHYSCIPRVRAGTSKVVGIVVTFSQVALSPYTTHAGIPGRTTSSSKESRPGSFNCSWVAQLLAHNSSINMVPAFITHSAPLAKEKDLNTTFQQSISSHQSNSPFSSCVIGCDIYRNIDSTRDNIQACTSTVHVRCNVYNHMYAMLWLLWITGPHSASCRR